MSCQVPISVLKISPRDEKTVEVVGQTLALAASLEANTSSAVSVRLACFINMTAMRAL